MSSGSARKQTENAGGSRSGVAHRGGCQEPLIGNVGGPSTSHIRKVDIFLKENFGQRKWRVKKVMRITREGGGKENETWQRRHF